MAGLLCVVRCGYDDPENQCDYAPSDCILDAPDSGDVVVQVSMGSRGTPVPVTIFKGTVESGTVLASVDAPSPLVTLRVPVGPVAAQAGYLARHCRRRFNGGPRDLMNEQQDMSIPPAAGGDPVLVRVPDGGEQVPLGSGVVTRLLGKGGTANVYEIWNGELEVHRAVKLLHPASSDDSQRRFQTEIKITAKLSHPNIV